ncbi:MAG TPA: 30S ribosomal protein S18 [Vampirovibrionales bacterium]
MKRRKKRLSISEKDLDLLNTDLLRRFVSGEGKSSKIIPHYVHGLSSRMQKLLANAIKRARQLNLM